MRAVRFFMPQEGLLPTLRSGAIMSWMTNEPARCRLDE